MSTPTIVKDSIVTAFECQPTNVEVEPDPETATVTIRVDEHVVEGMDPLVLKYMADEELPTGYQAVVEVV